MTTKTHNTLITKVLITLCFVSFVSFVLPVAIGQVHEAYAQGRGSTVEKPGERADALAAETAAKKRAEGSADPVDATIPENLDGLVYTMATGLGGFFLWIGGGILDYAVQELVVGMGDYLSTNLGVAVNTLWTLIRDLFNILFIFGLIYIGFRTILSSEDSSSKRTLGLLIVAALMINFSLFITKAIVDFSNIAALQLYSAIAQEEISNDLSASITEIGTPGEKFVGTTGISESFMNQFKVITYAQTGVIAEYKDEDSSFVGRLAIYGLMMMFIMLIGAFVFAAGGFLMISRFVALIIFMILSPAMFLGFIFPLFKRYQDMWWEKLLKYAFVAPAYLFMLYLSLFVIDSLRISGSFADAFSADSFENGSFMIFLNFFIIAGFLIASLLVAQQMGAYGANASMGMLKSAGNQVRRVAGSSTFGMAARAGRVTAGSGAKWATGTRRFQRFAAKNPVGKQLFKATSAVADSSFDARRVGGVGKKLGIGEGRKGGVTTIMKENAKKDLAFAESLDTLSDDEVFALTGTKRKKLKTTKDKLKAREDKLAQDINPEKSDIARLDEENKDASKDRKLEIKDEIESLQRSIN
ncbi:hypothetical protein N8083_02265, partial [Candidatus Pacebacteria bacterium]|nr:hypothetical protein [Candidatus Paceibacterota bacterium]